MIAWERLVGPLQEPITLAEAKAQARVRHDDDNALIHSYLVTAREAGELFMGRGFFTQTWRVALADFSDLLALPMAAPLQSITSVTYYDVDGTLQTLASTYYTTDTQPRPARLARAANMTWPALQSDRRAARVFVTYVVGWSAVDDIPERIKQGIRQYVAYLDADRDGMEIQALQAEQAAQRSWSDVVYWASPCA